jgi:glycerophosphoryl diester phosphodiesterase
LILPLGRVSIAQNLFEIKELQMLKAVALAAGLFCAALVPVSGAGAQTITDDHVVIAHRGASGYLPEHTLPAVALAYGMDPDFIEQDVVMSKDGVPVVMHDIHLDTTTDVAKKYPKRHRKDGRYYAIDFTLAELKTLNVHERVDAKTGKQVYAARFPLEYGIFKIPTFEEEIKLIQGLNKSTDRDIGIYAEIKDPAWHRAQGQDISKAVIKVMEKWGYGTRDSNGYIQCFDWNETKRIRNALKYQGRMVQLLGENSWKVAPNVDFDFLKSDEGVGEMAKVVDAIGPSLSQVIEGLSENGHAIMTPTLVAAQRRHLPVHVYTLRADQLPQWAGDFRIVMTAVFDDAGIDGAFTDFPDQVVDYLAATPE